MARGGNHAIEAARERVAATLERARHVALERLIIGRSSPATDHARRVALTAADAADRSDLVRDARETATGWVTRSFSERAYSGTWALTEMSMSVTRPADRAAVAEALADAVTADAVEDLVDGDTGDALRARWDTIESAGPLPEPGALSGITSGLTGGRRSLPAGIAVLAVGIGFLLMGSVLAIGFVVAGVVIIGNALRGRSA
ncbi:MAG TPA: hypothetical protein VK867_09335 [Candidatus Limnocylindrales bacterium]|nr:hypothetical protein [Candidatus Limnocylindrales bacterium]